MSGFPPGTLILNTRASHQAAEFSDALRAKGADVLELPSLEIELLPPNEAVEQALSRLHSDDYLVFTSSNAVRFLSQLSGDVRAGLSKSKIVVVGEATARVLRELHLEPHLTSKIQTALGLAQELVERIGNSSPTILFLKGDSAGQDLERALSDTQAHFRQFVVYRSRAATGLRSAIAENFSQLQHLTGAVFFSGNAAREFFKTLTPEEREIFERIPLVVPGPSTAKALEECGFSNVSVSRGASVNEVVQCLLQLGGCSSSG